MKPCPDVNGRGRFSYPSPLVCYGYCLHRSATNRGLACLIRRIGKHEVAGTKFPYLLCEEGGWQLELRKLKEVINNLPRECKLAVSSFETFLQEILMRSIVSFPLHLVTVLVTKASFEDTFRVPIENTDNFRCHESPSSKIMIPQSSIVL